jgi:hypothetical protein
MGGDQVHQRGPVRAQDMVHGVRVHAVVGGNPDHARAGPVQRVEHAGKRRVFHGHRLAGQHLAADEQVERLLAAGGDHDLV